MNKPTLFTAEYCPKCELAKNYLTKLGIEFDESQDASEAAKYGVSVVPCLVFPTGAKFMLKDIIDYCNESTKGGYIPQ